jgi:hypothetical protein
MAFDIRSIPMDIEPGEGVTRITVRPGDLYPVIITRIQEVLAGANPSELLATAERGGSARADVLLANARQLPAEAWNDAQMPREEFTALPYSAFVKRNGLAIPELLGALDPQTRQDVERMIARGYALEIALGWFSQAIRLEFGAYDLTITKDEAYRI